MAVTRGKTYRAELQRGLLAGLCALAACIPTAGEQDMDASAGFCIKPTSCNPDPMPPSPVNCAAAEAGLEFAPFMLADFEESGSDLNNNPAIIGEFVYSYTDATAQIYANGDDGVQFPVAYGPVAKTASLCTSDDPNTPNHVLHVTGGHVEVGDAGSVIKGAPFLGWGGGLGVSMQHFAVGRNLCFDSQANYKPASERSALCEPESDGLPVRYAALNLSDWDGVALWARRAPDSQPLLRVLVGNKYTDDDISYLMYVQDPSEPRFCERVRECACVNGKECEYWNDPGGGLSAGYYCGKPGLDPAPMTMSGAGVQAANSCGITQCNQVYPAYPGAGPDPQFSYRPCTPYAFRNGNQSSYCWDPNPNPLAVRPADPPPAEPDKQCGDHWTAPLHLTTEWQLYLVPFTTMSQQGWAKRWLLPLDTSTVSVVRLTWDAGWVDYWIDNLRFYRVRRDGPPDAAASASQ
jgi:hypothetical protein